MEKNYILRDLIEPEKWNNRMLTDKNPLLEYQFHAVMQVNLVGSSFAENLVGLRRHRFLIIRTDTYRDYVISSF